MVKKPFNKYLHRSYHHSTRQSQQQPPQLSSQTSSAGLEEDSTFSKITKRSNNIRTDWTVIKFYLVS